MQVIELLKKGQIKIAHRGFRGCFPENTMAAFRASLSRSPMLELDVQLSRDLVPVVFHDTLLSRTTNVLACAGLIGPESVEVGDWSLTELQQLDAGSWFIRQDPFGTLHSQQADATLLHTLLPQRIPTLEQVLQWAVKCQMFVNIELKAMAAGNKTLVEKVIACLHKTEAEGWVLLSSFRHDSLRYCRELEPTIPLAALQEGRHPKQTMAYLKQMGVCAYHPSVELAAPDLISQLQAQGIMVNVFTVNELARQRELFACGVTGVFTDFV